METEEYALVRCSRCGEYSRVAWELLGDISPSEIVGYVCSVCYDEAFDEPDSGDWEYEMPVCLDCGADYEYIECQDCGGEGPSDCPRCEGRGGSWQCPICGRTI